MAGIRLYVIGTPGSGKTTAARLAATRLGLTPVELDAIRYQAGWQEMPDEPFRELVAQHAAQDSWIIDGNYTATRAMLMERATQVVWLHPPRPLVMARVIRRSLTRAITRRELWNGNREQWSFLLSPGHPIRWAWRTHRRREREFEQQMNEKWVQLRSRQDVSRWLETLAPAEPAPAAIKAALASASIPSYADAEESESMPLSMGM